MACLFVEPAIVLCFFGLLLFVWRGSTGVHIRRAWGAAFMVGAACSVLLEIVNERWFAGQGAIYPCTLLSLWPFEFPVAIVIMTGLYAAVVGFAACRAVAAISFSRVGVRLALVVVAAALFNLLSLGVEHAGVAVGYWRHLRAVELSRIYPFVYLFYGAASLPAAVAFFSVRHGRGSAYE